MNNISYKLRTNEKERTSCFPSMNH